MTKRERKKERKEHIAAAEREVQDLQIGIECAYSVFNNTADPELLEASILELRALQSRYGCALRNLKLLHAS